MIYEMPPVRLPRRLGLRRVLRREGAGVRTHDRFDKDMLIQKIEHEFVPFLTEEILEKRREVIAAAGDMGKMRELESVYQEMIRRVVDQYTNTIEGVRMQVVIQLLTAHLYAELEESNEEFVQGSYLEGILIDLIYIAMQYSYPDVIEYIRLQFNYS